MSKHTPGPWQARRVDNQEWQIDAPHGDRSLGYSTWRGLVTVYGSDDMPREGRLLAEANANLIAAAPEMLDTLKKCLDALVYVGPWETPVGLIERVQWLIDKAEGNDAAK